MAQESQNTDSIYDFLYVDSDRLKSWVAQVFNDGILLSHKQTVASADTSGNELGGSVAASGEANAIFAKAGATGSALSKNTSQTTVGQGQEKQYDAAWSLPLQALDLLSENAFIERDLDKAGIGSMILSSGTPMILDIKVLQDTYSPKLIDMVGRNRIAKGEKIKLQVANASMKETGQFLLTLPTDTQFSLLGADDHQLWGCLKKESLLINPSTIALTFGVSIPGTWHVLAILDALPGGSHEDIAEVKSSMVMGYAATMFTALRDIMGRPKNAHGITPVMIFREIKTTRDGSRT